MGRSGRPDGRFTIIIWIRLPIAGDASRLTTAAREDVPLKPRFRCLILMSLTLLIASACGGQSAADDRRGTAGASPADPGGILTVANLIQLSNAEPERFKGQSIEISTYINSAPSDAAPPSATQSGCPVVLDRLPALTDQPFSRQISVAGVELPNPIPSQVPALTLVIPYSLGIIDVPRHARLRGHLFDPEYAQCDNPARLFVLDSVVQSLGEPAAATPSAATVAAGWPQWSDAGLGLTLAYPTAWRLTETRNVGAVVDLRLQGPDAGDTIRFTVLGSPTIGSTDPDAVSPEPLQGDRQLAAMMGQAPARLVDLVGTAGKSGRERSIRLIMNYQGQTVILATRFTDGIGLNRTLLDTFTAVAASVQFSKPVEASDPLDPTLTANTNLGSGPFIGQATAEEEAIAASGLQQGTADEARLVPERDARLAVPGTCRAFEGHVEGVWLVTVTGVMPTGQHAHMLVYLDASTGQRLCQTPVDSAAP